MRLLGFKYAMRLRPELYLFIEYAQCAAYGNIQTIDTKTTTQIGELTLLPRFLTGFKGADSRWRKRREKGEERRECREKGNKRKGIWEPPSPNKFLITALPRALVGFCMRSSQDDFCCGILFWWWKHAEGGGRWKAQLKNIKTCRWIVPAAPASHVNVLRAFRRQSSHQRCRLAVDIRRLLLLYVRLASRLPISVLTPQPVADLEGAEPALPPPPLWATDGRRQGTHDKWKRQCIMATQNFDRFTVRQHALQNTHNDCHQWLFHSIRVQLIRFRPGPAGRAYSAPQTS